MPAMDSGERRQPLKTLAGLGGAAFPLEPEQLPCPRCDSTDTKFCYYNNYNLSQPRHFCKACRRYWTRGGTLRKVPVGGGTRRNNKRSRIAVSAATSPSSASSVHDPTPETPTSASVGLGQEIPTTAPAYTARSFTSLLGAPGSSAFMEMGGPFGLGLGTGFEDMGLGLGRGGGFWPYQDAGIGDALSVDGHGEGGSYGVSSTDDYSSWQFNGSESALADGDCFAWPDLAISMPGKGFK